MKKLFCLMTALILLAGFGCAQASQPADLLTDSVLEGKLVVEGVFYQMPIPVQQLAENGWSCDCADRVIDPQVRISAIFTKGNVAFGAWIINEYPEAKPAGECHVAVMSFGPEALEKGYDLIDVKFSKQIDINTSKKDLEKILGEPSSTAGGYPVWRGNNAKYLSPSVSFAGVYETSLFSSKLKYFQIEYMPADFSVEAE